MIYTPGRRLIEAGSRSGDTVRFVHWGSSPTVFTARLESPCRMVGTMDVIGYCQARFIAIR